MTLTERYEGIIAQYPPFINKIQFCEITGMCKSAVYKQLKAKKIKCTKRNKRLLHYYDIPITEALQQKYNREIVSLLLNEHNTLICRFYEQTLADAPDVFTVDDLLHITGYSKKTILAWLLHGDVSAQIIKQRYVVTKDDLIDYLVSERYLTIVKKSDKHLAEIERLKTLILEEDSHLRP